MADVVYERRIAGQEFGLYIAHDPIDSADADNTQARLWGRENPHDRRTTLTPVLGTPVRLTDGRTAGHVVEVAQLPPRWPRLALIKGATLRTYTPRPALLGIVWRSRTILKLARDAELVIARDGVFLTGQDATPPDTRRRTRPWRRYRRR